MSGLYSRVCENNACKLTLATAVMYERMQWGTYEWHSRVCGNSACKLTLATAVMYERMQWVSYHMAIVVRCQESFMYMLVALFWWHGMLLPVLCRDYSWLSTDVLAEKIYLAVYRQLLYHSTTSFSQPSLPVCFLLYTLPPIILT